MNSKLNLAIIQANLVWEDPEQNRQQFQKTIKDTLFIQHKNIMELLNSFESYEDPMIIFEVNPLVEESGEITVLTENILANLDEIMNEI